jgi:hypothetical protein
LHVDEQNECEGQPRDRGYCGAPVEEKSFSQTASAMAMTVFEASSITLHSAHAATNGSIVHYGARLCIIGRCGQRSAIGQVEYVGRAAAGQSRQPSSEH